MKQVWLMLGALAIAGCTPQDDYEKQGQPATSENGALTNRHHPMELPVRELHLNQGDKWKVSPEMLAHIEQMQREIEEYHEAGGGDFRALATALDHHLAQVIRASNMDATAREEFNRWLFPVMQRTEALAQTADPEMANVLIDDVQASLKTFGEFFE